MQPTSPDHRRLEGLREYESAFDLLLTRAQRSLRIFDRQLGASFNTAARADLLRAFFLRSRSNRLYIVLHDTAQLARDCPRLLTLVRQFSHAIAIHETEPQAKRVYDPFAIADEQDYLHRFHHDDTRALLALDDAQGAQTLLKRFAEIWEASVPAVFATTLGL